ncbi:MAG: amidase [Acidimicrobiaceae bacterium]|nr:amidase [Acidimicrobiaceae bacterium]MYE64625.1 amidase [Acidimicrobiaceae bacterium]
MIGEWTVTDGGAAIPEEILAEAAAAQATLGDKLAALRSLSEPFPETVGPAAADRWISDTEPRTPSGTTEEPGPASGDGPSPPSGGNLADLSAKALLEGYRTGAFDPVVAVDACLARIGDTDGAIGAVVTLDDTARQQAARSAERWHQGDAGPLEGVPVGVKDIINTRGLATEAGSTLFENHVPPADATVVARLRDAGAVIVAKTTTPEFAFGDESGDGVANPGAPGRWAGGSSSGSAAGLAAGLFPVALGSDTGGSIRVPSSYCGVSGIKPTFGRVPRDGVFGVSWTLDHVGPMARTVEDLGLVLGVIAGGCGADPYASRRPVSGYDRLARSIRGTRIGVVEGWLAGGCSPGVNAALAGALARLEELGCAVEPVPFPHAELAGTIAWVVTVVEFAAYHAGNMGRIGEFTPSSACRLAAGARTGASDYLKALRARSLVQRDLDTAFQRVDVLVTAATPTSAPDPATFFDDGDRLWLDKVARTLLPFNVTGQPALVMPAGRDEGRPAAIQIVAPPHADALCLRIGTALQGAC